MIRPDEWLVRVWRAARAGVRSLTHRDQALRDLDDELQHFVEQATRERVRNGLSSAAADRAARLDLGSIAAARDRVRDSGWESHVESFATDVRIALRGLRRTPAFACSAIITLALGIGASTAMFNVLNTVMLRPLPYREPERLVVLQTDDVRRGLSAEGTAVATIEDWSTGSRAFERVAWFTTQRVAAVAPQTGERSRARAGWVSGAVFSTLDARPAAGRAITEDDVSSRRPVAVISHAFWMQYFGGAANVVGQQLEMEDGSPAGSVHLTVVGVMPPSFFFPDRLTAIWTPATTHWRFARDRDEPFAPSARRWIAVARLRDNTSVADARAELSHVGARLAAAYPTTVPDFPGFAPSVVPMLDTVAGAGLRTTLWILLGAVTLVLLVACANVASLLLIHAASRQREFAVRTALGAGRWRLARQLGAESLVLAALGGAAGVGCAVVASPAIARLAAGALPRLDELAFDGRVLAFASAMSLFSALVFGITPALRIAGCDTNALLRTASHATAGVRSRRHRGVLVVAQCALTMVLLAGSGLLLRSLHRLSAVDPGFDPHDVLTVRLELPAERAPMLVPGVSPVEMARTRAEAAHDRMTELVDRVGQIPGVEAAGYIDDLFIGGSGNESIVIPGRAVSNMPTGELAEALVSPGLFNTLHVPLVRGRLPTRDDARRRVASLFAAKRADDAVLVNATFAARYFGGQDPIDQRFCLDEAMKECRVIVGVVGDMRRQGLDRAVIPQYYGTFVPAASGRVDLLVRTRGEPMSLAAEVRALATRLVPGVTIAAVATAEAGLDGFAAQRRLQTVLLTCFAGLSVVLAGVGIFGLAHYVVAARWQEIGIRVALGASPARVLRLVIGDSIRLPLIGVSIGLVAALALTRILASQLFEVEATDPLTLAAVSGLLIAIGAGACVAAARRAVRLDPVSVVREG